MPYAAAVSLHHHVAVLRMRKATSPWIEGNFASRKEELLHRYLDAKESAQALAREAECPPCMLLRSIVERVLDEAAKVDSELRLLADENSPSATRRPCKLLRNGKKSVGMAMREPALLLDVLAYLCDARDRCGATSDFDFDAVIPRLVDDIVMHTSHDCVLSPLLDETRREIGDEFEENLAYCLTMQGISFEREDELRARGLSKTPDVWLPVPILVNGRMVHWIESKALFGDAYTFKEHAERQLRMYANRFGSGLVIYWFGHEKDVAAGETDILAMDAFPSPDDVVQLSKDPFPDLAVHGPLGVCRMTASEVGERDQDVLAGVGSGAIEDARR